MPRMDVILLLKAAVAVMAVMLNDNVSDFKPHQGY